MRLTIVLCCLLAASLPAAERITINAADVVRPAVGDILGINLNYLTDSQRWSDDPEHQRLIAALKQVGPTWLRFPGGEKGDSHAFAAPPYTSSRPHLLRTGPGEWPAIDRRFTTSDDGSWIPGREPMTFDEYMAVCRAVGAQPLIVLPYDSAYRATAPGATSPDIDQLVELAAAWVRYANIDHDHAVLHWCLGNETDHKTTLAEGNPGAERYAADLQRFASAMRAVDPRVRIGMQGNSAAWITAVLGAAGDAVDFLEIHSYAGWMWQDGYQRFLETRPDFTDMLHMAKQACAKAGHPTLPIILSEFGVRDWAGRWRDRNDLAHALVLADMIAQFVRDPALTGMVYWNTRWVDTHLTQIPLGPDLLAPIGIDLTRSAWQDHHDDGATGQAEYVDSNDLRGLVVKDGLGLTRPLPETLLTPGQAYTLEARIRSTDASIWCGVGIDLLRNGEKIISHGLSGSGRDLWSKQSVRFAVPDDCTGARLWIWNTNGSTLRVTDLRLRAGAEPGALDAITDDGRLLASGQVLSLWAQCLAGDLVRCEATGGIKATATIDGRRVALLVINPTKEPAVADVVMINKACNGQATIQTFGGDSLDSLEPTVHPPVFQQIEAGRCQLALPAASVTLVTCTATEPGAP